MPIAAHILTFLNKEELRVLATTSPLFYRSAESGIRSPLDMACWEIGQRTFFHPESLPPGVNYKRLLLEPFPCAIDAEFWQENLGEVDDVPPIPRAFIEKAQKEFRLLLVPQSITIEVDVNCPVVLDATTARDGRQARLVEDPSRNDWESAGVNRKIRVPVTLNNIFILFSKCLKKECLPLSTSMSYTQRDILEQHGDIGVNFSYWTYQKKCLITPCWVSRNESGVQRTRDRNLQIVSLIDRLLYDLTNWVQNRKAPQVREVERTFALTHYDDGSIADGAYILWANSRDQFHVNIFQHYARVVVGVAMGIPPET